MILKGDDGLQYYYYVYMQGVNLFFPNILESILRDLPEGTDPQPLSPIFPAASPSFHRRRHNCKKSALRRFFYFKMKKYTNDTTATKNR